MKHSQYTIRSIPTKLDAALRSQARRTGRSLNETALEALAIGAGVTSEATFDDLNWFIGAKSLDSSFDEVIDWLDSLPSHL